MKKILILETNQEVAILIKRWCEGQYEAKIAGNEWATTLQIERPDLVITNYMRNGDDGIAVTEITKKIIPECKVLMITGSTDTWLENAVRQAGADGFLRKPFLLNELSVTIKKLLPQ